MRYSNILCLAAFVGLTACAGGSDSEPPTSSGPAAPLPPVSQTPDGPGSDVSATHPVYGALSEPQKVLLGADVDANGVRDDVDQFVAIKFGATPLMKKAVTAYAKGLTRSILFSDKQITDDESGKRLAAFLCGSDEVERVNPDDAPNWHRLVLARTADTEDRMRAWEKWDRAQNVTTSIDLETDPCVIAGL